MIKEELLRMRQLRATPKMIAAAKNDIPRRVMTNTYWGVRTETRRDYHLYLRCCVEGSILKVALYYPDNLQVKGCLPSYA